MKALTMKILEVDQDSKKRLGKDFKINYVDEVRNVIKFPAQDSAVKDLEEMQQRLDILKKLLVVTDTLILENAEAKVLQKAVAHQGWLVIDAAVLEFKTDVANMPDYKE